MKSMNRLKNGDNRRYEYKANMELTKLGRRQSSENVCTTGRSSVFQPDTRKFSRKSTIPSVHDEMAVDVPSILDSYRNRSNMWPKTVFGWATSPDHCRNLLRILDKGDELFLRQILMTLRSLRSDRVTELATHVIGCHFVKKLLEVGSEAQWLTVVKIVTRKRLQLINISCTSSGKGVVQKMIGLFKTLPAHISVTLSSLEQDTVRLATDRQGQSVVYSCLRFLDPDECKFIFETLVVHLIEIIGRNTSYDGFGGVIMVQHCLKMAPEPYQQLLMEKIADYALPLSTDPVGHYLLLDLLNNSKWLDISRKLVSNLEGNFAHLAMHNISSKVVEECLIISSSTDIGMSMECMVRELIESPLLSDMHQNIHAQSVIQSACSLTEGQMLEDLNAAIDKALKKT